MKGSENPQPKSTRQTKGIRRNFNKEPCLSPFKTKRWGGEGRGREREIEREREREREREKGEQRNRKQERQYIMKNEIPLVINNITFPLDICIYLLNG